MKPPAHINLYSLDNAQLLDIVRKYKLYDYPEAVRDKAERILEKRGLDQGILKRLGYLREDAFEEALKHYLGFKRHSKTAFLIYGVFVAFILLSYLLEPSWMLSLFLLAIFAGLIGFVVLSLTSQTGFYRVLGRTYADGNPLVFFFLGLPLYFLMYFHFKKKMEEQLQQLA